MTLKSFLTKIIPGKKPDDVPPVEPEQNEEPVQHQMSFEKLDTRIEPLGKFAEVDVYVSSDKIGIHTLAGETRIGRDPGQSDIVISELIVSKLHCSIYSIGPDYFIRDFNSTNGVYVNNERIVDEHPLQHNDIILLGKKGTVKMIFHIR